MLITAETEDTVIGLSHDEMKTNARVTKGNRQKKLQGLPERTAWSHLHLGRSTWSGAGTEDGMVWDMWLQSWMMLREPRWPRPLDSQIMVVATGHHLGD